MRVYIILSTFILFIILRTDGLPDEPSHRNSTLDGTSKSEIYPWLVSIRSKDEQICTGTIISENVVLTADSCFYKHNSKDLVVRVSDGSSAHRVIQVNTTINNVALLRVTPPFPCNSSQVRAIELAGEEEVVAPGTNASVVDWMKADQLESSNFVAITQCPHYFSTDLICVSLSNGKVGPGSYGGPLLKNGVQIGIIPWLFPNHPLPSLIAAISISRHRAWIKKIVTSFDPNKLKIGGSIKTHEHPWLVSIKLNSTHLCDGSIISKNVVLTAASCFGSHLPIEFTVSIDTTAPGSIHIVTDSKIHERYGFINSSYVNDVALLKVSPPFQFNSNVSPISLVRDDGPYVRVEPCERLNKLTDGPSSNTLSRCPHNISDEQLCLESLNQTVCQFTGGPLVKDSHLIGFKPKGRFCLSPKDTKVYNYALYYGEWIRESLLTLSLES